MVVDMGSSTAVTVQVVMAVVVVVVVVVVIRMGVRIVLVIASLGRVIGIVLLVIPIISLPDFSVLNVALLNLIHKVLEFESVTINV